MVPSRPSSSHFSSSAATSTHFPGGTKPPLASSTDQAHISSASESCSLLSFHPFLKKHAWAVAGAVIAISGSVVLLACSSAAQSSAKQARRCSSTGAGVAAAAQRRGLAAEEVQSRRSRAVLHSQGTNTEAVGPERESTITLQVEKGKGRAVIEDADVCSAVPEVIIRDTSDSGSAAVHALIDADTIDRSAPLTIYSSLTCAASDTTIRTRPVSWSEPYITTKEELDTFTSYHHSQALEEPLKPHTHIPSQRKNIPILNGPSPSQHHVTSTTPIPLYSSSLTPSPSLPLAHTRPSLFSDSKHKETHPCSLLSWSSQMRIDLVLLLCILSSLFYYFYLKREIQKPVEIQQVKPFPIFRFFP